MNGETLTSDKIFINTGTRPRMLPIPGLDKIEFLTNRNIMDLKQVPAHLIALGGNYLGLEFGQMFRRLGSEVTVVELGDQIIPREDPEISQSLREALEEEGMRFRFGSKTTKVAKTADGIEITIEKKDGTTETLKGSHLLVCIGQVPNSDDLGLDKAGIETDQAGFIRHNGKLETNVPGVWVLGDVKGGPAFTHVSYDDYLVIYDNVVNGKNRTIDNRMVPYALYTDPELGRIGLSEREARAKGYRLKIGSVPMAYVARAIERGETKRPDEDRHQRRQRSHSRRDHPRTRRRRAGADPDGADDGGRALDLVQGRHVHPPHAGRRLLRPHGQCRGRLESDSKRAGGDADGIGPANAAPSAISFRG